MIDLHLHTTASDGQLAPAELVRRAASAAITVMSVTDHDTVVGLPDVRHFAIGAGIEFVDGIEITAVEGERDVHMLGYFIDPQYVGLGEFLDAQRAIRVERVKEICAKLAQLGVPVPVESVLAMRAQRAGSSVGRPLIARALVQAGHVSSMHEAFDRFLAAGQPAFVPRVGSSPERVLEIIHSAGGLGSMAHPGVTRRPQVLAALVDAGLDAVEVYHSDHPPEVQHELEEFVKDHQLLMTGGSDFHGDGDERQRPLGGVTLPRPEFDKLRAAAAARRNR